MYAISSENSTVIRLERRASAAREGAPMRPSVIPKALEDDIPLVVDLDGALIHSDLVVESLMLMAKYRPWRLFAVLLWLFRGIAPFKQKLAQEVMPDINSLPFDPALFSFLDRQKAAGRRLVLATGADVRLAEAVAAHTGLFDRVISSDGINNVHGRQKRDRLVMEFGLKGFDYAGNRGRDGAVLAAARRVILVGATSTYPARLSETVEVERVIAHGKGGLAAYWKILRPSQWIKNILIFLPLLTVAEPFEATLLLKGVVAAIAFSLCASSAYIFNDLIDLPSDRQHPVKKNRPIASGQVSLVAMLALVPVLFLAGVSMGTLLPAWFSGLLVIYYVLTLAYSLRLKDIVILDVLVLASFYTLRVLAGAIACGVTASVWVLAFCIFLFLSLGLVKRYAELVVMQSVDGAHAHARAYLLQDRGMLASLGAASGYLAGLLLVLFQTGGQRAPGVAEMDVAGWGISLLFLYWISYVWLVAHRGRMGDDPLAFAMRDKTSRIVILLVVAAFASKWA